jgi:hypothetical protein
MEKLVFVIMEMERTCPNSSQMAIIGADRTYGFPVMQNIIELKL